MMEHIHGTWIFVIFARILRIVVANMAQRPLGLGSGVNEWGGICLSTRFESLDILVCVQIGEKKEKKKKVKAERKKNNSDHSLNR